MLDFKFDNQGQHSYVVYQLKEEDFIDTLTLGMITTNKINNFCPVIYTQEDERKFLKYNISSKISLEQEFMGTVNKKTILNTFKDVANALISAEDYMINQNNIVLDKRYIYHNLQDGKTELICLPIGTETLGEKPKDFFKNIMFNTKFNQAENCDYVAMIINYLNSDGNFLLSDFRKILLECEHPSARKDNLSHSQTSNRENLKNQSRIQRPQDQNIANNQASINSDNRQNNPMPGQIQRGPNMPQDLRGQAPVNQPMNSNKVAMQGNFNQNNFPNQTLQAPKGEEKKSGPFGFSFPTSSKKDKNKKDKVKTESKKGLSALFSFSSKNKNEKKEKNKSPKSGILDKLFKKKDKKDNRSTKNQAPPQNYGFSIPNQGDTNFSKNQQNSAGMNSQLGNADKVENFSNQANPNSPKPSYGNYQNMKDVKRQNLENSDNGFDHNKNNTNYAYTSFDNRQNQYGQRADNYPNSNLGFQSDEKNFGQTTVLGNFGNSGETTVLSNMNEEQRIENYPYLMRLKNNERINIDRPVFKLGKEKSSVDYFISDNQAISRNHATLINRNGTYFLIDNNSTNATYVNGKKIDGNMEVELRDGDAVTLANEEFNFHLA